MALMMTPRTRRESQQGFTLDRRGDRQPRQGAERHPGIWGQEAVDALMRELSGIHKRNGLVTFASSIGTAVTVNKP